MVQSEILILGAGVAGLAAASALGERAVVLDQNDEPGGLVRSVKIGDYWFDHVLHLLYFNTPETERRICALLGETLARTPPAAWVETAHGTTRFPIQQHLAGLDPESAVDCIRSLAESTFTPHPPAANFEEMLLQAFGRGLCELFFFPYNRKAWKRPLSSLAASGFTWNIARPDFAGVVRGALSTSQKQAAYNANGWYPRPRAGSELRGMGVLSKALAAEAADLRLNHTVTRLSLTERVACAKSAAGETGFRFTGSCFATIPLPKLISICDEAPADLKAAASKLLRNRVFTAMFAVRGPRPQARGHWRYYADESVVFTRLIYMHEFDPLTAPPDGWGLMAEITEPAEWPRESDEDILDRVEADVRRVNALAGDSEIIARRLLLVDPAYVVFTPESAAVVHRCRAFLEQHGIHCLGRYGRWEYSSMAQVITDGFALADEQSAKHGG